MVYSTIYYTTAQIRSGVRIKEKKVSEIRLNELFNFVITKNELVCDNNFSNIKIFIILLENIIHNWKYEISNEYNNEIAKLLNREQHSKYLLVSNFTKYRYFMIRIVDFHFKISTKISIF